MLGVSVRCRSQVLRSVRQLVRSHHRLQAFEGFAPFAGSQTDHVQEDQAEGERGVEVFQKLRLPRRAWHSERWEVLPDENRNLQHFHGVLHVQQQGRLQRSHLGLRIVRRVSSTVRSDVSTQSVCAALNRCRDLCIAFRNQSDILPINCDRLIHLTCLSCCYA